MSDSDSLPSSKNASVSDNGKSGDSSPPSQESSSLPPLQSSPSPPFQESSPSPPFQESSPSPPSQESISSPPSQESKSSPPSPESNSSPPSSNSSSLNSGSPSTPWTSNSSSSLPPPPPLISQPPPPSSSQSDSPSQNKSSDDVLVPPSKSESIPSSPNYVPSDESPPSSSSSPSPSSGSNHNTHEFRPSGDAKSPPKPSQSHSSHRPTDNTPVVSSDSSYSDERQARSTPPLSPLSLGSLKAAFNGGDISTGAVVMLVLVVVVITVIMIFFINARRKKKRKNALVDPYRQPPSFSVKPANYYNRNGSTMGRPNLFDPHNGAPPRLSNASASTYGSQRGQGYYSGPDPSCSKSWFSYEEMVSITNGFSGENLIGEGGFGCVYKGILPDGKQVAVKQLKSGSGQGEREFRAEVEIISRVHHRHLVSLVGYSIFETQRLLVYEFVPNNTLEHHLHGKGLPGMDWPKRLKIAIGSAKGLAYLHEDCHPRIIHRDIKSANILIDNDWEAQVADFGLAKLSNDTHTHVSTRVMGTFGYLAPEYASSGKLTDRSDVFSFGVVLLEIITGRKPVDASQPLGDESLVEWARPLLVDALETGDCNQVVDPRLENIYAKDEMLRMIKVAAACVRHSAPKRPRMVQVVRALDCEGDMADLSNGMKFGQSQVYDSSQQSANIHRFRLMALGTEDFSSEYGYSGEFDRRSSSHSGEYHSRDFYRPRSHEYRSQSREYSGHVPQNRNFSKLWRSEEISGEDSGEAESRAMYRSSCERSDVGNHGYGSKVGLP